MRRFKFALFVSCLALLVSAESSLAQDRSGFRGGPPGGDSFRGGPPGGGSFGGGPPGGGFRGGPPGGGSFGGSSEDRSERFKRFLDGNGNGRLDQDEIERIPSRFRDAMQERGIQLRAGADIDKTFQEVRERFEQARQERESGRDGGSGDDRSRSNRSAAAAPQPFRARQRERITVDLPPKYSEMDTDADGQIALHEWLLVRRTDLEDFDLMDIDFDGLLTPYELKFADETEAGAAKVTSFERERLVIVDANGASGGSYKENRSKEEVGRLNEQSERYFGMMDRNKDGQIDADEWGQSRRLRPMFEAAQIKIQPMSVKDFQANYLKATAAMEKQRSEGGGDRSSWGGDRGRGGPPGGGDRGSWGGDRGRAGRG